MELTRQDSTEEVRSYLQATIGLKPELASEYAKRLTEEGYDSVVLVDELTIEQLTERLS
eukprot:COSAG06_NODE_66482_length_254_cov_0.670968_1_plen_58_part_01